MKDSSIPLPETWPKRVKSALVNVISMAHATITCSRGWCADSSLIRVRQAGELNRAKQEIAMFREEIRIKDSRMAKIPPHQRPFYPSAERLAILTLRAARGWSIAQTARVFLIEPATAANWTSRLDEDGEHSLVRLSTPVNKYPDFVALAVQQLKCLCPVMGKKRIVQILARLGLQLSASSAGRFMKQKHQPPDPVPTAGLIKARGRKIIACYPNHVWHVDLTVIPTQAGFWTAWLPFSAPQIWPFAYWVALIIDHFSRMIIGFAVFKYQPSSLQTRLLLSRAVRAVGQAPKYIISDKGPQFFCHGFRKWCKRRKIKPRFGAIGRYGSIALIERCIRSLKTESVRQIIVPLHQSEMRLELGLYVAWYNELRPHQALNGRTPREYYDGLPRSPTQYKTRGKNGVKLKLSVAYLKGRNHLPIVSLQKAA